MLLFDEYFVYSIIYLFLLFILRNNFYIICLQLFCIFFHPQLSQIHQGIAFSLQQLGYSHIEDVYIQVGQQLIICLILMFFF